MPSRPELVERHGWDVKYGSHALRLAYQGRELAAHGRLTLPLTPGLRARVIAVKTGQVSRQDCSAEIDEVAAQIRALLAAGATPLPEQPNLISVNDWSVTAHRRHWESA